MRSALSTPRPARRSSATRGLALAAALLGAALALQTTLAQAQWTWRDKAGRVTASDLPPPREIADKDILSRPAQRPGAARPPAAATGVASGAAPTAAPTASAPVDPTLEARKKAADAEKTAKAKAEDEQLRQQRADNCRRARAQALALDSGQRMARLNDQGERETLDDKGRADELRRAREVMASECR